MPALGHRVRVTGALLATLCGATPAIAEEQPQEPVMIIDLSVGADDAREQVRAAVANELERVTGITGIADAELRAALAGVRADPAMRAANDSLAMAQRAYGALRCDETMRLAEAAIEGYAGLQAAGAAVLEPLQRAYTYLLLCADHRGATDTAMWAAAQLRALGATAPATAPASISSELWQRYPALDAVSNALLAEFALASVPAGARLWVDHQPSGATPATVLLREGTHVLAVANENGSLGRIAALTSSTRAEPLVIPEQPFRWRALYRRISAWRGGAEAATAQALGAAVREAGARFALVLAGDTAGTPQVELWGVPAGSDAARRLGTRNLDTSGELVALIVGHVERWDNRSGAGSGTIVSADQRARPIARKPHQWWVYASIIGAVALGTIVVVANDAADDRQRIELTWP